MITYTWNFDSITVKPLLNTLTDVVYSFGWRRDAVDAEFSASVSGIIVLPEPDPDNFKPYQDLKKTNFEDWAKQLAYYPAAPTAQPVTDNLSAIDQVLADQIEQKKNPPTVVKTAPWQ